MEIKFKKLAENAKMPTKAHESDAGFDLYVSSVKFSGKGTKCYHSGIAMEIPAGKAFQCKLCEQLESAGELFRRR